MLLLVLNEIEFFCSRCNVAGGGLACFGVGVVLPTYSCSMLFPINCNQCCGSFLTPGFGIGFFQIPNLVSRIQNPYF
jgi:hypothetical protein